MRRDDLIALLDDLEKAANHKYIRRIPTGKPKPRYRYIYDARKAVDTKARPQVGEKIKIEHNGQAGHYEVKRVMRDGRSVVQHDETGHRMVIRNAKLHDLTRAAHAPADPKLENDRLDEKHRKVDLLPRSRKAVLESIKQASGIDDHDLAQADAEYAAWKGRGRKGPKPQRPAGKGGELDAFSADLKRGQRFSSLLEAFEHATKGAKTWRDIAPIVSQLREVPGFENAHLPEDALLRHAMQDEERRTAPDSKHPNPEDFGVTVPKSVDEQGFDWNTGEQHPAMATPAEAKAAKKRAREAKANPPPPRAPPPVKAAPAYAPTDPDAPDAERPVEDAEGDASFDFGANAPPNEDDDIMWRSQRNLVIDLSKAFDGAPSTTVSRQNVGRRQGEGSRGGHIVGHTPGGDPIYAKAGGAPAPAPGAKPGADPHAEFAKLQAAHQQAMAQMQQAHAAMQAHAQKHGITMPGSTQTGPSDPTRLQHSVARGPSAPDPESTGVVAQQKPAEKTATKKGPADPISSPASGESPEESVPKADGILAHGIVGHTKSGKQIKLGMNHETLSPREAQEASLLHRDAQEHLLNANRHSPNPAYKKAARAHLDEEFALASKAVTGQTEAAGYIDPDEEQIGSVFASAKKSLAGWEAFANWSPSAMWAGEDIGITFGARLEKALGGERAGHKYIKRTPRAGGGYDYEYADTPHSKETLKGAPLGSQLEVEHNGETATYTKVGRDDWKGAVGGAIASGWFVGKPGTLTHGAPHPEPGASAAPAVDPGMWRHQPKFGVAGGPLEHVLTSEGAARAFQVDAAHALLQRGYAVRSPLTGRVLAGGDKLTDEDVRGGLLLVGAANRLTTRAEVTKEAEKKPELTEAQKAIRARLDEARAKHKAKADEKLKQAEEAATKARAERAAAPIPAPATEAEEQQAAKEAASVIGADPLLRVGDPDSLVGRTLRLPAQQLAEQMLGVSSKQREWAVGRHIWGSAKDKRDAMALIEQGRIGDLSHEAAATLINRASLMPAFDSGEARTRGVSPGAAHMIQSLTALVAPKPADTKPETIAAYAQGVRLVAASLHNAKTRKDVEGVIMDLRHIVSVGRTISQHDTRVAAQAAAELAGPHASVSSEYVNGKTTYTVSDQNPAMKDAILALGQRFVTQTGLGSYRREHFYATGPYGTSWGGMGYGKVFNDAAKLAKEADSKGEDGWAHVGAQKAAESAARAGKSAETRIPPWRRSVPDKPEFGSTTKAVTHGDKERFGKTFGIAVQRGEAISDKDLDHHLRHAEMALHDMARVLAIDPKLVSFKGRLGIAFGARGHGGALAHYEPLTKAINLTRNAGAGSLAHEWGHFMDNVMHETQTGLKGSKAPYISEETRHLPPDLAAAVSGVYDAMHKHRDPVAARAAWKKRKEELRVKVDAAKAAYTGTTGEARSRGIDDYNALVDEHNTHARLDWDASDFKRDSVQRDAGKSKKYWSSGREMWARAFESYVQDKLAAEGGNNSYLVAGTKGGPGQPYPEGDERKRINGAFDKFFEVIRTGRHLEKALKALSSRPLTARGPKLVITDTWLSHA